jgi:hypothetical protein
MGRKKEFYDEGGTNVRGISRCSFLESLTVLAGITAETVGAVDILRRGGQPLQAALAERDPYLTRMDAESYFDPYRSHPRYRYLLERRENESDI